MNRRLRYEEENLLLTWSQDGTPNASQDQIMVCTQKTKMWAYSILHQGSLLRDVSIMHWHSDPCDVLTVWNLISGSWLDSHFKYKVSQHRSGRLESSEIGRSVPVGYKSLGQVFMFRSPLSIRVGKVSHGPKGLSRRGKHVDTCPMVGS